MTPNEGVSGYRPPTKMERGQKRCMVRPVLKRPSGEDWTVVLHNIRSLVGVDGTRPIADPKLANPFFSRFAICGGLTCQCWRRSIRIPDFDSVVAFEPCLHPRLPGRQEGRLVEKELREGGAELSWCVAISFFILNCIVSATTRPSRKQEKQSSCPWFFC